VIKSFGASYGYGLSLVDFSDELLESRCNVAKDRVVSPIVTTLLERKRTVD
jgi:hypothetical protein